MRFKALLVTIVVLAAAGASMAGQREDLVRLYVDSIVVNSLDEPGRHEPYFSEPRLAKDFSAVFAGAYAAALAKAGAEGEGSLFEADPMTGDANRCPIGKTVVSDLTRADTRIMVEALLKKPACDGDAAGTIRLMFFLKKDEARGGRYVIDDILRAKGEGAWASLQAWLERRAGP